MRKLGYLVMGAVASLASALPAQDAIPRAETAHLRGSVYLVRAIDSMGTVNLAVSIGPNGLVLVDHPGDWRTLTVDSGSAIAVRRAVAALGDRVRYLIDTHWHGDHTAGNVLFARAGVPIVAHENTWHRLTNRQTPRWYPDGIGPMDADGWPTITFADSLDLEWDGPRVRLYNFGPAHTDGDAVVWFADDRVAHLGDLYHGFRELSAGEDMVGLAATLASVLERLPDEALLITGHGDVQPRGDLATYHEMLVAAIVHVRAQLRRGASDAAVRAAGLPAPWDTRWEGDREWLGEWLGEIRRTLTARPR